MPLSVTSRQILRRPTTGSERIAKRHRYRTAIVLIVSCIVLIAALVACGFLYAWYTASQGMADLTINEEPKPVEIRKPVSRLNQRVSVAVSSFSSPVSPGDTVQLSIRTNIDSICNIDVYSGTQKFTDPNLTAKAADEFGIVTWTWPVSKDIKSSTWPITITCNNKEYSGLVKTTLLVK